MKITNTLDIKIRKADSTFVIFSTNSECFEVTPSDSDYSRMNEIYKMFRAIGETERAEKLNADSELYDYLIRNTEQIAVDKGTALTTALTSLIDFFTEFSFEPNFRFVNTLARCTTSKNAKEYISNYFSLIDSPYINEVVAKIKSKEFDNLIKPIVSTTPTKTVNNRFKLYYGSQGTGKTTIAQKETDGKCIVCNSSMLPSDLMEDFVFVDGKATFKPSMLWRCMEEGKSIVLDEINLLPFDSLRFLQGILDGKTEFQYKGNTVHINEGFMIIGTMNLTVNGMTYGLPEPLVDRCAEMRKFSLTADDLAKAIMN